VLESLSACPTDVPSLDGGMSAELGMETHRESGVAQHVRSALPVKQEEISTIFSIRLIWRTYEPDGSGGFFPLMHPSDQRIRHKVEIWTQMNAYWLLNN
jgi:hypothetical protein